MNIYLLRHGETDWNKDGRIQGHTDIPLNQKGRAQIGQAAEVLAGLPFGIDSIYSSPLKRAYESAEIVADRLSYDKKEIIVEPMLIERCFGEAEGLTAAEREAKFPNYQYADTGYYFPGIEPYKELLKRAEAVLKKIVDSCKEDENILIVSHGALLFAMIAALTDEKISFFGDTVRLDSASLHLIEYTEDQIRLEEYNVSKAAFIEINF